MKNNIIKKIFAMFAAIVMVTAALSGCDSSGVKKVSLDPKRPTAITIWHYYNGANMNAFDALIKEFNETVGKEKGVIVEGTGLGSVVELEKAVIASAKKEVGSMDMPNIFASYADTAYQAEKMGILANLDDYLSKEELSEYIDSYIEEGRIGLEGELRIFPIVKSTEIFMINETDWLPFAQENNVTYDNLKTLEDVTKIAKLYYEWTDGKTPDIENDGKAFFGRDSIANLFIIGSKSFGTEIFQVENGVAKINVSEPVMRKIWDNYYVPYISGYFTAYGKFSSDDAKVGDILAYIGSSSSVTFFPSQVTVDGNTYPVKAKTLPIQQFENTKNTMVQQGASMVVTKGTEQQEYACVVFLKWFTEKEQNIRFSVLSGYLPVKKESNDYDTFINVLKENNQEIDPITDETLKTSLTQMAESEMYTNKAFDGGTAARAILENHLHTKAVADREEIVQLMASGLSLEEAVSEFNTDENFKAWLSDITAQLESAAAAK